MKDCYNSKISIFVKLITFRESALPPQPSHLSKPSHGYQLSQVPQTPQSTIKKHPTGNRSYPIGCHAYNKLL